MNPHAQIQFNDHLKQDDNHPNALIGLIASAAVTEIQTDKKKTTE